MFKKFLASLGIGAATVDTQLEKETFVPGEDVHGKVFIQGGETEQTIDAICIFLMTEAVQEVNERKVKEKVSLEKYKISDQLFIGAGENKEIPFTIQLPLHTPASFERLPIWFETGVDIPMALDPEDRDPIDLKPHPHIEKVIEALENQLSFRLREVEMEYSKRHGFVQEFEFSAGGEYHDYLEELEAIFFISQDKLDVMLEVDRRARGLGGLFSEALEMDESRSKVTFKSEEFNGSVENIADKLKQTIDRLKE
ncbi:sporulation protein [Salimicrobium flavidum]|uniref:Sporulation-control protein n=1 Tax=Salimicrobium flavidum TaxID=570947 RepID=A0A1N7KSE9_9BACI|nr:sporulation protein [Salimicrobium flavidum]SIS64370.1 sporulation-control protein [Salimicrobium flavidum]